MKYGDEIGTNFPKTNNLSQIKLEKSHAKKIYDLIKILKMIINLEIHIIQSVL